MVARSSEKFGSKSLDKVRSPGPTRAFSSEAFVPIKRNRKGSRQAKNDALEYGRVDGRHGSSERPRSSVSLRVIRK